MAKPKSSAAASVDELIAAVLRGEYAVDPAELFATGAMWIAQSTNFPGTTQLYRNYYLLLRSGAAFGACCVERDDLPALVAEDLAGASLATLLNDPRLPVRIAALDAYFGSVEPHRDAIRATPWQLPLGTPQDRALARDRAIVSLLKIEPCQQVALIGVVNPLVQAIHEQGGVCLPCDFNLLQTQWGEPVSKTMEPALDAADVVIATGMTLSNGSFDRILERVRARSIPLVVYAQTGSSIVPQFLDRGVTAVSAEPFPFSQFSAEPSVLYRYQ
ncbi:Rossmann-like domain-containing protein [Herpetosiphon sp. NSE202]|uniref:Rossmann-like domain-containing protein n=1 Tax=Herpetosiphon sp. NSE202 TaxID=3351349 RepID=UPI0036392E4C